MRKDADHYAQLFPDADPEQPYVWPDGRPASATLNAVDRDVRALWVVRPADDLQARALLQRGVVGLDASSGVDVDVSGTDERGLVALLRERAPRRRPGKALRQQALLTTMRARDSVGLLVVGGAALVVGQVVGDYRFGAPDDDALGGLVHTRPVRWHGTLSRTAVRPPALLQDPRSLFRVAADSVALEGALQRPPSTG